MEAYLKVLIETHTKANRLSKEIRKHRGNIIKAYKNKSSSDLYISKINYTPLVAELNKETATFNELLKNLEENDFINNYNDTNSEIIENSNSDISVDTNISQKSYDTNTISNYTNDETKLDTETSNTPVVHIHLNDIFTDNTQIKPAIIPAEPINKPKAIKKCKKDSNDYLSLVKNKDVLKKTKNTKRISGVKSGYKYNGKGFEVFTGYRNKCQPIYSSTMLYCKETCNEDKDELIKYLIKFGYFNNKMIEDITFTRGYYKRHALIKVRGELKYITKKIKQLNKANKDKKTEIDGLIIYYSGHGCSNDWMFCSNGELLSFYEIKNEFQEKKCKILASKPKLFYFDCCRDHIFDKFSTQQNKWIKRRGAQTSWNSTEEINHDSTNMYTFYATANFKGNEEHTKKGGPMTNYFVEYLTEAENKVVCINKLAHNMKRKLWTSTNKQQVGEESNCLLTDEIQLKACEKQRIFLSFHLGCAK
eukprot:94471_1